MPRAALWLAAAASAVSASSAVAGTGTAAAGEAIPIDCALAIIGGGPGGVYTAWRLAVDTNTIKPSDICIFERAQRVGGRTFSFYVQGPKQDLVVELGAYRFCSSLNYTDCGGCEMCMPMMSNLIKTRRAQSSPPRAHARCRHYMGYGL